MEQVNYYHQMPQVVPNSQQASYGFWNGNFSNQPQQYLNDSNNPIYSPSNNYNNIEIVNDFGFIDYKYQQQTFKTSIDPPTAASTIFVTEDYQHSQLSYHNYDDNISLPIFNNNSFNSESISICSSSPLSTEQSPEQFLLPEIEDLDSILNELETTGINESLFIEDSDEFNDLLDNFDGHDSSKKSFIFDNINQSPPSSINDFDLNFCQQQPAESANLVKRKFSLTSSSSTDYYSSSPNYSSSDYSEYCSPSSSPCSSSWPSRSSSISEPTIVKKKRTRRSKHTKEERAARKKDQNKKAAERYRNKKKFESEIHEHIMEELEQKRQKLLQQYKKIETELNVILPLARITFQNDPIRNGQLQELLIRLSSNNNI